MPCIAGLPDGTYLILNGGQHGVAGFGLGDSPNLNAVLYDPTKPVNSRMSIMANTTVAVSISFPFKNVSCDTARYPLHWKSLGNTADCF